MRRLVAPPIRLLVLDGDHTLWQPLDGAACSEQSTADTRGCNAFRFAVASDDADLAIRDDGLRFRLAPGARPALAALGDAGIGLALASFNHPQPVRRLLATFGLLPLFRQVVATWSSDKAVMLRAILAAERRAGRPTPPEAVLFVDDDPRAIYRAMAAAVGVRFAQMGNPLEVRSFAGIARLAGVPTS